VVRILDVAPDLRSAELSELRIWLQADLSKIVELVVPDPVRLLRFRARPVPSAGAIELAAFDRQCDFQGPLVAGDEIELRPGRAPYQIGDVVDGVAGGNAAHDSLLAQRLFEC